MQNYYDLQPIGQGQYGTAYRAHHRLDGNTYCIKKIPMSAKDDQTGALKEVQLLAQLDHPNIIAYKESFIDQADGGLCIVTSFCEEGDLFQRIKKRAAAKEYFKEEEVMDMFVQIASALMHIHSKRILHRDLKTQNIFIAKGNIIKLGDFGISKVLEKTDQFATTVTGTPYYMAPEICTNQPYTFKSDIWSLGCVLYELCTLKHAFAADSLLSLVFQIVRGTFPPIPTGPKDYSKHLSTLVNALLCRDTSERPSLAQVFQMPYVAQNIHRYHEEFRRQLMKQSSTMVKRRQHMERTMERKERMLAEQDTGETLTPKERMRRKKELEGQKREMELRLASMGASKERSAAAERKAQIVHASNVGLPGSALSPLSGGQKDASRVQDATRKGSQPDRAGGMDGSFVNMDTMPAGTTLPSAATRQRMQQQQEQQQQQPQWPSYDQGNLNQGPSAYQALEDRPLRPAGAAGGAGPQAGGAGASPAPAPPTGGALGDTVLMGTVGGGSTVNYGTMAAAAATRPGSQGTALGAAPPMPRSSHIHGPNPTVWDSAHSATAAAGSPATAPPQLKHSHSTDYSTDFSGSEYEFDFEDYNEAEEQQIINQKVNLLKNIEDLEQTTTSATYQDTKAIAQVRERVAPQTKAGKAAALRTQCEAQLGRLFPEVYAYLRNMRTQGTADESQIKAALAALVGNDKAMLQGCFLVDQLVFQEMIFSDLAAGK